MGASAWPVLANQPSALVSPRYTDGIMLSRPPTLTAARSSALLPPELLAQVGLSRLEER